jgi:hypothetical protein
MHNLDGASYKIEHCSTKRLDKMHLSALSSYPSEIIPLKPVDGTDNQFGQVNKMISDSPYIQVGINGFKPPQPFHVSKHYVTTTDNDTSFHWPTLEETNADLLLPKDICDTSMDAMEEDIPKLYTGPPPSGPTPYTPTIPPTNVLAQSIISSANKLFFLSIPIGSGKVCEWHFIQLALEVLMSSNSSCLVDGQYLVDYYICHPADSRYNAINQCYWLRYHNANNISHPMSSTESHLLQPSDSSESYAHRHNLFPYHSYNNLTHANTYI